MPRKPQMSLWTATSVPNTKKIHFWKWRLGGNVPCEDDLVHNVSKVVSGVHFLLGDNTLARFNQEVEFKVPIFGGFFASVLTD